MRSSARRCAPQGESRAPSATEGAHGNGSRRARHVSEDATGEGAAHGHERRRNITISRLARVAKLGIVSTEPGRGGAALIARPGIKAAAHAMQAASLSGGTRKGRMRAFCSRRDVFWLDEPTRG